MTDLVLTEPEWSEVEGVQEAIEDGDLDADRLWQACADEDEGQVWTLLERAGFEDLPEREGLRVTLLAEPDASTGKRMRLWFG